nr:hypothetical protein P9270_002205 [Mesorhizobium sp. WSM4875]
MITDEQAKAAQEIAKLGQKGIEATGDFGGFFARTFGKAIEHIGEAMADKAAAYRLRNRARVVAKTKKYLDDLGVTDFKAIDFRNGIPLLEGISDEPDEALQDVWAAYIANALNPEKPLVTANRQLIDIIKKLEPEDLKVLDLISLKDLNEMRRNTLKVDQNSFPMPVDELAKSLARLTALGLFTFENGPDALVMSRDDGGRPCRVVIETSVGEFAVTLLLMYLKTATERPEPSPS